MVRVPAHGSVNTMIEFKDVSKRFGPQRVVDSLSFKAPSGQVTGFLGPNGAGKSTTFRILCGLVQSDQGCATIDGRLFTQLGLPGREIGVMLDAAAQHPGRTGHQVLCLAAMANRLPHAKVVPALERVGLADAGNKRVGDYSLGMRQRLGLACALIGDPHTLVLDEPANGLEPEGIRWMRTLLDTFANEGGTVLLSSHLLGEVQAIADHVVMIDKGRLVADVDCNELLSATGSRHLVHSPDQTALGHALDSAGLPHHSENDQFVVEADADAIARVAFEHGVLVTRLQPAEENLESRFLALTHH